MGYVSRAYGLSEDADRALLVAESKAAARSSFCIFTHVSEASDYLVIERQGALFILFGGCTPV